MRQNPLSHQQILDGALWLLMWRTLAQEFFEWFITISIGSLQSGGDLLLIVLDDTI